MAELINPSLDFSALGNLGNDYRKGRDEAMVKQSLASLGRGPDGKIDTAPLLNSGNLQLSQLGIQIEQRQQDQERQGRLDTRQLSRDAVSDKQHAESMALQRAAAARAAEDKFTVQKIENPDGSTSFVRIKTTGGEGAIPLGLSTPAAPNNPYASTGPKLNADQSKAATMTDRMADANTTITKNEDINNWDNKKGGYIEGVAASIPFVRDSTMFNTVATPDRQKTVQAQRNFVNAILRLESGAAVSESEFNNAQRQYFPQPGDTKEVLEQKRQNRVTAMQGMARQAGPGYRPPASLTGISANPGAGNVTSSGVKWSVE